MIRQFREGATVLSLLRGDLTLQEVDAIVNAANPRLAGGGGVDGAIHRAGGAQILRECQAITSARGSLATGDAVITGAGQLKARFVIHTVGPVWQGGGEGEDALLAKAYRSSLLLAVEYRLSTIAFPSISSGAYGFPLERAARIAVESVRGFAREHPGDLKEIRFVVFTEEAEKMYAPLFPDEKTAFG
jgi:O-acetyl-ADP-ribose deacetylase (regulator of RNase III)